MNEIAFMELLQMIQRDVAIDDLTKRRIEQEAQKIGRRHGSKRLAMQERRGLVRDLLAQDLPPTAICTRLMVAYEISERQAYRDIEAVRGSCQNSPKNGREKAETTTNEEVTG